MQEGGAVSIHSSKSDTGKDQKDANDRNVDGGISGERDGSTTNGYKVAMPRDDPTSPNDHLDKALLSRLPVSPSSRISMHFSPESFAEFIKFTQTIMGVAQRLIQAVQGSNEVSTAYTAMLPLSDGQILYEHCSSELSEGCDDLNREAGDSNGVMESVTGQMTAVGVFQGVVQKGQRTKSRSWDHVDKQQLLKLSRGEWTDEQIGAEMGRSTSVIVQQRRKQHGSNKEM
ncbi:hypothetical protein F5Y19DRAFT_477512 [Xylariaceae sp. FL1651]|nr:hypothetical protein F5Y19DRAFT_477512 [Xylariaceae sp. FL1651]